MRRYPEEIKEFIRDNVKGLTTKELTDLVNHRFGADYTDSQIRSYKSNHNLKSGTPKGWPKGTLTRVYPKEVSKFILDNYLGISHKEMAETLNKKFGTKYTQRQIKGYYGNNNLNSGLTGYFPKGHVPYNKGKKGIRMSEATEFKKGHTPSNYKPVGTERVNAMGYMDIKIKDPSTWKAKHVIAWEEANGLIPKGHVLLFADRNKMNIALDNLVLVSRRQLALINKKRIH